MEHLLEERKQEDPLVTERKCFVSGETMDKADLGLCIHVATKTKADINAKRLPEMNVLNDSHISRIAFNQGIKARESGSQDYVIRTKDGKTANYWFPLTLRVDEHWVRTLGPNGTKKIAAAQKKVSQKPRNIYFLLDNSGSMSGAFNSQCRKSMIDMLDTSVTLSDYVSLSTFNDHYQMIFPPLSVRSDKERIRRAIDDCNRPDSVTHLYSSMSKLLSMMDFSRPCILVVLTDGEDNENRNSSTYATICKELTKTVEERKDLTFMMITVGRLSNERQLRDLRNTIPKGEFIASDSSTSGIKTAYEKVGKLIVSGSGGSDNDVVGTQDLLMSAFSLIISGENGQFKENDVWSVSAKLLSSCILDFAQGKRPLNAITIRDFSDMHRTLVEMLREYPKVKQSLIETVKSFCDKTTPNNRRRELVPNLGEFIIVMSLIDDSDAVDWSTFLGVYIQEVFRRNARWYKLNGTEQTWTMEKQLTYFWDKNRISMNLITFSILFIREVVHRSNRTVDDAVTAYDTQQLSYLDFDQLAEVVGKFDTIKTLDSFEPVFKYLGLSPDGEEILRLVWAGISHVSEPETHSSGSLIKPANNIRNVSVNISGSSLPDANQSFQNLGKSLLTSTKSTRKINHVGWNTNLKSTMSVTDYEKLLKVVTNPVNDDCYSAVIFGGKPDILEQWASENENKTIDATMNGVYNSPHGSVASLSLPMANDIVMVITQKGNVAPNELKKMASSGKMGAMVQIPGGVKVQLTGTVFAK